MNLATLLKEYAAPASATSGLAGYSLEGQRDVGFRRALRLALARKKLLKGDVEGHEFHGNQWTEGGGPAEENLAAYRVATGEYNKVRTEVAPLREKLEYYEARQSRFGGPKNAKEAQAATDLVNQIHEYEPRLRAAEAKMIVARERVYPKQGRDVPFNNPVASSNSPTKKSEGTVRTVALVPGGLAKLLTDRAAHEAATSPLNLKPQPTEAQRHVGNYPKGHVKVAGLDISIENPAGSHRRQEWPALRSHYGYVLRTEGADGEQVDCFVRVGTDPDYDGDVHVVNQVKADGSFDEHKAIIGHETAEGARQAYLENYERGWTGLGSMVSLPMEDFKAWLAEGDTTKPLEQSGGNSLSRLLLSTVRRFA